MSERVMARPSRARGGAQREDGKPAAVPRGDGPGGGCRGGSCCCATCCCSRCWH
ncbi:hypothetical protein PQR15_02605 [Streptomyces lydicus]|nr:hypothetical protein [Streptomyces lydicus]